MNSERPKFTKGSLVMDEFEMPLIHPSRTAR